MDNTNMMILRLFFISFLPISTLSQSHCSEQDFEYTYTNCDSNGERWRVAVPRPNSQCSNLPPPQKGLNCSFSCPPGNYLDLDTQGCRPCNPGFFSLGGGVRFEEFQTLPPGFSIDNFDPEFSEQSQGSSCPKETGWIVMDGELMYIPTQCVSRLSFSANLVRPGSVDFTYRMPRNNRALSMQVDVRNEQCQSYSDIARNMMKYGSSGRRNKEEEEKNGDWRRRRLELRTGTNVISWTVSNSMGYETSQEPVHIAKIDVLGLAFTRECTACPPGTYSSSGSAECLPCAAGYFSSKGSSRCGQCPQSQFSGPKSEKCEDRPACRQSDYYPVREPCTNGSSRVTYNKVMPAVCRDDLVSAAKLPSPGPWSVCPKCNPGMGKNKQGICEFCEKDHYSDGNECKRCAVDTVPNYGYQFIKWDVMPPKLTTRCEYISDDVSVGCNIGGSWIPSGDSLISAPSLERGIAFELVLSIDEGFWNPLAPKPTKNSKIPVAQVTFVFETSCADATCVLYFIEDVTAGLGANQKESFYRFLAAFNGTQPRKVWSHTVTKNTPARYMVAFLRSGVTTSDDAVSDEARIFSINVTNVGHRGGQGGGASECLACPHTQGGETCVPCPAGNYMHEVTKLCVSCPTNNIVNASSTRVGISSCIPCGEGLITKDGVTCTTTGKVTLNIENNATYNYDFSPWISKNWNISGVRIFSREGSAYYHLFKVSLFSSNIKCEEQFDNGDMVGFLEQTKEAVEGMACRVTALPTTSTNHSKIVYVSPFLLANKLESINLNRTHAGGWNLTNQVLEYDGLQNSSLPLDVFFWFESIPATSQSCPNGNILVVVARCQPNKKQEEMRLPHSCPDGTCDGCLFVIILETAHACPVCDANDYETIKGECVNGKQTIHSIPHKHCVLTGSASESHEGPCSILSSSQRLLLLIGTLAFASLSVILLMMCRRNQRLEYKYTRLIENSRTGELPAAETCGLDEDEDDDELQDRVIFSKGRRDTKRNNASDDKARDNAAFISLDNED